MSAEPVKSGRPSLSQVSKVIHKQKLENAVKLGDPSLYYKPCLQKPKVSSSETKLNLLQKAFLRLEKRDPELCNNDDCKT